jgi:hypothetical protein
MSYTDPRTLLVNSKTREPLNNGDKVLTFRGEPGTLQSFTPPKHAASTGRVYVKLDEDADGRWPHEFFPSVIDAKFINPTEA